VPGGPTARPARPPRAAPLLRHGWLHHDRGHAARRVTAAIGSPALTTVSCLVLRFAHEGLRTAGTGTFVTLLTVVTPVVCGASAFRHAWDAFGRRPGPERRFSPRGLLAVRFVGSLLEAPGEKLRREEHEAARTRHDGRTPRRPGNPRREHRTSRTRTHA